MPVILAVVAIIVIVVVLNWFQGLKVKRRTRDMQTLAERLGLSFVAEELPGVWVGMRELLLLAQGRPSSKIKNVMQGEYGGVNVTVFDYTFNIPVSRYVENWRQTVVQFRSDQLTLPQFSLCPRDVMDAVVANIPLREQREAILGTAGVRFSDRPDFSKRYKLMGPERAKVEALFDAPVLVHYADVDAVCTEGEGHYLFYYRMHTLLPVDEVEPFLREGLALFRALSA